jgi:hypothetical protein
MVALDISTSTINNSMREERYDYLYENIKLPIEGVHSH